MGLAVVEGWVRGWRGKVWGANSSGSRVKVGSTGGGGGVGVGSLTDVS